ncbi:hypothetical protein KAU51_02145 [Candidatus Parcubacteria bacterium]|nr:hypothetical protein [Candidatus Parcubacteria bacterium]
MKEKIKIAVNKEANSKEISDLKNIANSCGLKDFSVENSSRSRELGASMPPELWMLIKFSVGVLVTGFFGAMGVDLWKGIKKFVVKSFKYYENPTEPYLYNPDIYIEVQEGDDLKLQIFFPTRNFKEQELKKSLKKLDKILKNYKLNKFSALYFSKMKYLPIRKWKVSKIKFKNSEEILKENFENKKP